jgi:hypothetical protein
MELLRAFISRWPHTSQLCASAAEELLSIYVCARRRSPGRIFALFSLFLSVYFDCSEGRGISTVTILQLLK